MTLEQIYQALGVQPGFLGNSPYMPIFDGNPLFDMASEQQMLQKAPMGALQEIVPQFQQMMLNNSQNPNFKRETNGGEVLGLGNPAVRQMLLSSGVSEQVLNNIQGNAQRGTGRNVFDSEGNLIRTINDDGSVAGSTSASNPQASNQQVSSAPDQIRTYLRAQLGDGSSPPSEEAAAKMFGQLKTMGATQDQIASALNSEYGTEFTPDDVNYYINSMPGVQQAWGVNPNPNPNPQPVPTDTGNNSLETPSIRNEFDNNPGAKGFVDLNPIHFKDSVSANFATIPEFLKPFLADSANASEGAIRNLGQLLGRDNALVNPFNALQNQSQASALDVANGGGGFIPQAQDVLKEIAGGEELRAISQLSVDQLTNPMGQDALAGLLGQGVGMNSVAQNTLEDTASGNYLYGNSGFDAAVDAAVRSARPHILSQFAGGGSGAVNGGLAQTAIAQAASDAFARQFGQERANQLNASNSLNQFNMQNAGFQQNAANSLIGSQQYAGNTLANVANAERGRQMSAASQLPTMGLLPSTIMGGLGAQQQAQSEREKLGNIQAMQTLMGSSFGNINPTVLFGNSQKVPVNDGNKFASAAGGMMSGAQMGSAFGPWGTAIGAGVGLLGGLG